MMATATPPTNTLRLGRTSYVLDDVPVGYCRKGDRSPVAKERVKVKKRRLSPPRLPPPPPPPGRADSILTQDELGSPTAPLQAQVEPLNTDVDELESFKKLGLIVSPHKIEPESNFNHTVSDSNNMTSSPVHDYPVNPETGYVSVNKLNTESALGHTVQTAFHPHFDTTTPNSVNDATSPSPLPLPEPDFEPESPVSSCIARYQPRDNLDMCGVDDQDRFDCNYPPSPFVGGHSALPLSRTVSDSLQNDMPSNGGLHEMDYFERERDTYHSPGDDLMFDEEYGRMAQEESSDGGSEEENTVMSSSCPSNSNYHHQPVSRQLPTYHRIDKGVYGRPLKSVGLGTSEPMSTSLPLCSLEEEPQVSVVQGDL